MARLAVIAAPFPADAAVARRMAELAAEVGDAVVADVRALVERSPELPLGGSTISVARAEALARRHGLASTRELAVLAIPVAKALASPPISGFRAAAVGIEAGGDLVLGWNMEFPGTDLGTTVHAEAFVPLRARRRRQSLDVLAVPGAHPCAFCRQTLAESAAAGGLAIIDPLGHEVRLEELYPQPFTPSVLGVAADAAASVPWSDLRFAPPGPDDAIAAALLEVGSRAHAPYSEAPSAVVLELDDGRVASAACVESVAFNPTITALQAALVEVAALRADPAGIRRAWLARTQPAQVDPEPGFRALLRAVAPRADASVVDWRRGG